MTTFSYQLYSSRNFPPLDETLRMLGDLGYSAVEGFGGIYTDDTDLAALRASLDANGLVMASGHFGLDLVEGNPARVAEICSTLGITSVYVPFLMPDARPTDAKGWAAFGARLAAAGRPIRDAGLDFGWHNHDFELVPTDSGETPLDLIAEHGEGVSLELDIAWVVRGGADPLAEIAKHADRITGAHLKDIAPPGEAEDEDGWADVGHGTMDWPALMAALGDTPCRHFVMEHDNPNDHARFASRSLAAANGF